MEKALTYILLILCATLMSNCGIDKWNLDDQSNESIPNYSETLFNTDVNPSMQSNIIALDDNNFITATQDSNSDIQLRKINQEFSNDNWLITSESILNLGQGDLAFFDSLENEYLVGFSSADGYTIQLIDENFNLSVANNDLESFIDTAYNDIDSIHLVDYSYITEKQEILIGGELFSQGTSYSCLVALDRSLNPIWIRTYFENSKISSVLSINQDTFLLLNTNEEGSDLIRDDYNSISYAKYDLTNDQLFFGSQSFYSGNIINLTGIHDSVGRTIEVNLESNTSFINDIDLHPVSDIKAVFLSRDNFVVAGIQSEGSTQSQFSSELGSIGSIWCHRYIDDRYVKILDIIEMPGKGVLISSIVEREGEFHLHVTRIDEEGATFVNVYSENCI